MRNRYMKTWSILLYLKTIGTSLCCLGACSSTNAVIRKDHLEITQQWHPNEDMEANQRIEDTLKKIEASDDRKRPAPAEKNRYPMELWDDPTFRRQFMGSYGIRTEIEPEVTEVERETLQQVMNLLSEEKMDKARNVLEVAITPDSNALFDFILGNLFFQKDDLDAAEKCYGRAVDKFPDFLRAHKNLAMVEVRNGKFDAAIGSLARAIELGEGSALTYGLLGHAYASVENHVTAESAFRFAMMLQPASTDWQLGLAQSLFKQEKYADAAALCNQLIAKDPENIQFWRLQANAYLGLEALLKAAQNYEYIRSMGEADVDSLNKLGDIYVKEKMLGTAAEAYSEALKKDSGQSPDTFIRNAKVLVNHGGFDEAHQLAQQIRETSSGRLSDGQKVELLRLEARITLDKGADERQSELLQEIVRIDPMDGEALILLGQYFARKNDPEKAVFYYERAEAIEAVEAKAKIRHAQLLVQESKYQEAVPLLESALRIEHRDEVEKYLNQVKAAAKSRQ